jgi:hypothetical protein
MSNMKLEIESLNMNDLDVEELENRLEMATESPDGCYINTCEIYFPGAS